MYIRIILSAGMVVAALSLWTATDVDEVRTTPMNPLEMANYHFTQLLEEIKENYNSRPNNTAKNEEFEHFFEAVLNASNLEIENVTLKIDAYTDFNVYDTMRKELENQIGDQLANTLEHLTDIHISDECRSHYMSLKAKYESVLTETNLAKKLILNPIAKHCKSPKYTIASLEEQQYRELLEEILRKYETRSWEEYPEFEDNIWRVFLAAYTGTLEKKKNVYTRFNAYDALRIKLDIILKSKIEEVHVRYEESTWKLCKNFFLDLKKEFQDAFFQSIGMKQEKIGKLVMECSENGTPEPVVRSKTKAPKNIDV